MDFLQMSIRQLLEDPITHGGLILGGALIGIGVSSLYWSYRWRQMDTRLLNWERQDRSLKEALADFLGSRPCVGAKRASDLLREEDKKK